MTSSDQRTEEFIRLVTHYQPRVYWFILSLLPNHADAEEVLQNANLVLWRKFEEFVPGTNFRAWAFQVAYHEVQDFFKRQRHDRLRFNQQFMDRIALGAMNSPDDLDFRQEALTQCLGRLGDNDRHLIHLHYESGTTVASVAKEVGRSVDAIYKSIARIRRALHDCIRRKLASEKT